VSSSVDLRDDRRALEILQNADTAGDSDDVVIDGFIRTASANKLPGQVAFLLHDTYGFPVDLTQLMARERGVGVDMEGYESLMGRQRERARSSAAFGIAPGGEWTSIAGTDGQSSFVGYDTLVVDDAAVRSLRALQPADNAPGGSPRFEIVLDRTPFYAESGGQVGDRGVLVFGDEEITVLDTYRVDGMITHQVDRLPSNPRQSMRAVVDRGHRIETAKHHSATHLLHAALREELGPHVAQKGSLVAPDRLRFDFSHFERVSEGELLRIAGRVNEYIQNNVARLEERDVPVAEALSRGAIALFGEKYGDRVRVITFDPSFSVELCGGTHVKATGELGLFQFVSEGSVASGIRRVEAVVGRSALQHVEGEIERLDQVRAQFKALQNPVEVEVGRLLERTRSLEKELAEIKQSRLASSITAFMEEGTEAGGVRVVVGRVEPTSMDVLRNLGQVLKERMGEAGVGVLGTVDPEGGKVYLAAAVTPDLVERGFNAGKIISRVAGIVGGGGGGRPDLATAGGRHPDKLDDALRAVVEIVGEIMGET
jgi:alanyl-tRNA synthetase